MVRPGVRQFAADLWSRRRGLTLKPRPEDGWVCARSSCAPLSREAGPVALWWGRRAPDAAQLAALCQSAPVVSVRAVVQSLPSACERRLVLDGMDYSRGGSVELWRTDTGWRAVWAAEVRGDRPWSRTGDPDAADSGVNDIGG